jgi:hypothetical protein
VRITKWQTHGNFPWLAIWGTSWEHPKFKDGGPITTSAIRVLDLACSKVQTLNSVYELEDTTHKSCYLSVCGGELCCVMNSAIRCSTCSLVGCKVCFADLDALFVKSCSSNSKLHTWDILGVK